MKTCEILLHLLTVQYNFSRNIACHASRIGKCSLRRLPVTLPRGNFATVTSPQKLRHMVTSPHFEKVKGDVGIVGKCVGVWGEMWEEV